MEEVKVAGYKGKREKCVQDKENAEIEYQLLSKNKSISTVKKSKKHNTTYTLSDMRA